MNRLLLSGFLAAAVSLTEANAAPVVTLDGVANLAGAPVTDVFTSTVELVDEQGVVLLASSLPGLPVTDGRFSIDLDIATAVPAIERGEVVQVRVELREGLVTATQIGPVWRVALADRADRALLAENATLLGALPASELVPDGDTLGAPLAFVNLSGVPAGVADGVDNGTIDTIRGLVIVGGVLDVAPGAVTDILNGTVTGRQLPDGSITSSQVASLTADKFADGTLTGANFADASIGEAQVSGTIAVFERPSGCANPGLLTTETRCEREACSTAFGCNATTVCLRVCGSLLGCENLGTSPSQSVRFCNAPADYTFMGRLIRNP